MGCEINELFSQDIKDEKMLLEMLDTDGSGTIEYSEFVTMVYKRSLLLSQHNLTIAFNTLKGERDGITKEDLQRAFGQSRDIDEQKNAREDQIWDTMMKSVDKNDDKIIDEDEFMLTMQLMLEDMGKTASI